MDTLQCAIVLAKLERFDWEVEQRLAIGERYNQLIDEANIRRVVQREDRTSVFAQYTILVDSRDNIRKKLLEKDIPTAVHYPLSLHKQVAFQHPELDNLTKSHHAESCVMSLPIGPYIQSIQQSDIVASVEAAVLDGSNSGSIQSEQLN